MGPAGWVLAAVARTRAEWALEGRRLLADRNTSDGV
ncbi:hypothetical protein M2271_000509 [Streptomyces sp. LBL]|nr:hypothetical protein [Streptomyces sp. LBL]